MATLAQQLAAISKRYTSGNSKLANGKTMLQIVNEELKKLEGYIRNNINQYLSIYDPHEYIRTGAWLDSLVIDTAKINGNTITARILFNDAYAYHPSVIGSDQPMGYVPTLMETGWDISGKIGRDIPMFTKHPGIHYIKDAVDKFNGENKYGIKVSVYFNGEKYM